MNLEKSLGFVEAQHQHLKQTKYQYARNVI